MNAYDTITLCEAGKVRTGYVITARNIDEATKAANALAIIHRCHIVIKPREHK